MSVLWRASWRANPDRPHDARIRVAADAGIRVFRWMQSMAGRLGIAILLSWIKHKLGKAVD